MSGKTPQETWAMVAEAFIDEDYRVRVRKCRIASRAMSKNPHRHITWVTTDGFQCVAHTKSEARGLYKKERGKIPAGVVFSRKG
jgi:hypothetical protein